MDPSEPSYYYRSECWKHPMDRQQYSTQNNFQRFDEHHLRTKLHRHVCGLVSVTGRVVTLSPISFVLSISWLQMIQACGRLHNPIDRLLPVQSAPPRVDG